MTRYHHERFYFSDVFSLYSEHPRIERKLIQSINRLCRNRDRFADQSQRNIGSKIKYNDDRRTSTYEHTDRLAYLLFAYQGTLFIKATTLQWAVGCTVHTIERQHLVKRRFATSNWHTMLVLMLATYVCSDRIQKYSIYKTHSWYLSLLLKGFVHRRYMQYKAISLAINNYFWYRSILLYWRVGELSFTTLLFV